jgi:hypothetical protein
VLAVQYEKRTFLSSIIEYYRTWPVRLYHTFPHYVINDTFIWKKCIKHEMFDLIFSTTFIWNISHSKKNWATYYHKGTQFFMYSGTCCYFRAVLIALEYSRQIFETSPNLYIPLRADIVNGSLCKIYMYYRGNNVKFYYHIYNIVLKHLGRKSKFSWIPHNAVTVHLGGGEVPATCTNVLLKSLLT